jgi:hypothetical protein
MRSAEQIVVLVVRMSSRSVFEAPFNSMMTMLPVDTGVIDTGCEAIEAGLLFRCSAFRGFALSGRRQVEDCW